MKIQKSVMIPVLLLGVLPFIMTSTESLLNITFNASEKPMEEILAVGAITIMSSLMQVLMLPILGLTQGAQPIISYNYGAKNNDRVKKTFKLLMISSLSFSFVFWLLMSLFPKLFVSLFSNDPKLVATTMCGQCNLHGCSICYGGTTCLSTNFHCHWAGENVLFPCSVTQNYFVDSVNLPFATFLF